MWKKISIKKLINFIIDILFPRFCFGCQKEGVYLCKDCLSTIDISEYQYCLCKKPQRVLQNQLSLRKEGKCPRCRSRKLNGLFFAVSYDNLLVKNLIQKFKYKPFIKDLAEPLSLLIINHFKLLNNTLNFSDFILVPIPLTKRKLKWRGFNQSEEIAKRISEFLKVPLYADILIKIKETLPQVNLKEKEREKNIENAFFVRNRDIVSGRKILLVDDIYTTGSTMEESAKVLKNAKTKEVWGVTVARE